jgi:hypothetical protein
MIETIVQDKYVLYTLIVIQVKPNHSFLQAWASSVGSSEALVGLMKRSRNKFPNIVTDVPSSRVVADKED